MIKLKNYKPSMIDPQKYGEDDTQHLFIQFLLNNPDLYARCENIINPDNFNKTYQEIVEVILEHSRIHRCLPKPEQLRVINPKIVFDKMEGFTDNHNDWFLKEFEQFCRHKAWEKSVLQAADMILDQDYDGAAITIKEAQDVGLVKDLGTDYAGDPALRLKEFLEQKPLIPTGWRDLDYRLYGGLNRGEMTIFCGGSGAGKSVFLQNLALTWFQQGMNVAYISMELDERLVGMRIDAMATGMSTGEVKGNVDKVASIIKQQSEKGGTLRIKQLPCNVSTNDIKTFLREYEIQSELTVDAVLIDYLDLLMPVSKKINGSDLYIKDKFVAEEIRNLAVDRGILCVTASQLNRASVAADSYDHSHIAGGISKIQTADNVISIRTNPAMRKSGSYELQLLKTRSSSGVGSHITLDFDISTLRVTDGPREGYNHDDCDRATNMLDSIKRKSTVGGTGQNRMLALHAHLSKQD